MTKRKINIAFVILFLLFLLTPTCVQIFGIEKNYSNNENRALQTFPDFRKEDPIQFVREFKAYYFDNFGMRLTLFNAYQFAMENWVKESPLPKKVMVGKEGWYFLGDASNDVVAETIGAIQFTEKELQVISSNILKAKKWLADRNIGFYVSVAPNKHSVYKEKLPFNVKNEKTKLTTLKKYLKTNHNFDLIDLKEDFISFKDSVQLYYKYDSHWNDTGAFFGYRRLMESITKDFKEVQTLMKNDITIDSLKLVSGDLMRLLNQKSRESVPVLKVLDSIKSIELPRRIKIPFQYKGNRDIYEYRFKKEDRPYKILIFRDSFTIALQKFINETFGECVYIWDTRFDKRLIEKEKPDMVIYEVIERDLEKLLKM